MTTSLDGWDARWIGGDPARPAREVPGLLRAIALGDRSDVDAEMIDLMRATGTAHLLAVSGSNVGLAAWVAAGALRLMFGLVALRRPRGVGGPWLIGAALVGAVGFTVFVGLPTSAQRAMAGALAVALAALVGRPIDAPDVIGAAAIGMIVIDPSTVATASFHLSFGAVIGLATWGKALDARLPPSWPGPLLAVLRLLIASTAATIGTLPASAWWFQALSPLGTFANLFAVPWSTFVLTPAAFAALLGPDAIAEPAMAIGVAAAEVQRAVLRPLAVAPWTPAVGPLGALLLSGIYVLARRPAWAALLITLTLGWPRAAPPGLRITMFDVGQGLSLLAEWPDGRRWLIDGGPPRSDVVSGLRRLGVRRLDRVLATHGDIDHVGGLLSVMAALDVGELDLADRDGADELIAAAEARGVPIVDGPAERLWPQGPVVGERNLGSLVLALGDDRCRLLVLGDAPVEVDAAIGGVLPPCDAVQVGHHGSRTSTSAALLDAVAPRLALIPVGAGNTYGHPTAEVLERLAARGLAPLRTDLHGTIELTFEGEEVRVRTHRYGQGWVDGPSAAAE